jgi:hypothetical protein
VNHALSRQHATPVMNESATQCSLIETRGNLIGKTCEHAAGNHARRRCGLVNLETFITSDREELLAELPGFAGGGGIDSKTSATSRIELIFFCEAKGAL